MKRQLESGALVFCAVFALALLVYGPLFFAPPIGDDLRFVQDNPFFARPIQDVFSAVFSTRYLVATGEATYQPLVTLLNCLTHSATGVYRLIGVLLHALNALLLWALARKLGASAKAALAAALAFAAFPTHTETLAMSGYKGHILAFLSAQGTLLCWMSMLESARPLRWLLGAAAALSFGFFCKETALVALPLCAAYSAVLARDKKRDWQLACGGLLLTLAAIYLAWRFIALEPQSYVKRSMPGPLALLGWYVKTLVLPYPLCRERVWQSDTVWDVLGAAYLGVLWWFRRRPKPLFAALFIGACCLPFLRIVPFASDNAVADRYVYGPAAGLALLLSLTLTSGRAPLLFYGLIAAWACEAVARDALYTNVRALCEQGVACAPSHPRARAALAQDLVVKGEFERGKAEALKALSLDPRFPGAYNLLGIAQFNLGDIDAAQDALDHAAVFEPDSAEIRMNLANVLLARGFEDEALENYTVAAQLRPDWEPPRLKVEELRAKIAAEPKDRTPRRRKRRR